MPEEKKDAPAERKLLEKDFQLEAGYRYTRSAITLPAGWSIDDVLKPVFWTHIAKKFAGDKLNGGQSREGAIIEVRNVENTLYAELFVRAVTNTGLVVALHGEVSYFGPKEEKVGDLEVKWNVGKRAYDVVRKSDAVRVAEGFPVKEAAIGFIERNMPQARAA